MLVVALELLELWGGLAFVCALTGAGLFGWYGRALRGWARE